jgi:hypothetical protein
LVSQNYFILNLTTKAIKLIQTLGQTNLYLCNCKSLLKISSFIFLIISNETNRNIRKERVFRDRLNPLEVYNDNECIQRFRFDRKQFLNDFLNYKLE